HAPLGRGVGVDGVADRIRHERVPGGDEGVEVVAGLVQVAGAGVDVFALGEQAHRIVQLVAGEQVGRVTAHLRLQVAGVARHRGAVTTLYQAGAWQRRSAVKHCAGAAEVRDKIPVRVEGTARGRVLVAQ